MHLWAFVQRRAAVAEQTKTLLRKSIQFLHRRPNHQPRRGDFGPDCARQAPPAPGLLPAAHLLGRPPTATGGAAGEGRRKKNKPQTHVLLLPLGPSKEYLPAFFYFFVIFRFFFIAFLGVSRHEEPRNSEKTFLQIFWSWPKKSPHDPKNIFF